MRIFAILASLLIIAPSAAMAATSSGPVADPFIIRLAVLILAGFVGYYVVWAVTPALHTPLMSMTNAISGVVIVGAIIAATAGSIGPVLDFSEPGWKARGLGLAALGLAMINIAGGFMVTRRMLSMYKRKPSERALAASDKDSAS